MNRVKIFGTIVGISLILYLVSIAMAQSLKEPVAAITTVLPDGRTQITIHNGSNVLLTAFAIDATQITTRGRERHSWLPDSTLAKGVTPIPPGGDFSIVVARASEHPTVKFRAALFQDGSSFGESVWIQRLKNSRRYSTAAVAAALADMRALAPSSATPADLAKKLDQQKQMRIAGLPKGNTDAIAMDRIDWIHAYRSRYMTIESMITGGRCRDLASTLACANAVAAAGASLNFSNTKAN
jgi:hypothetical protein